MSKKTFNDIFAEKMLAVFEETLLMEEDITPKVTKGEFSVPHNGPEIVLPSGKALSLPTIKSIGVNQQIAMAAKNTKEFIKKNSAAAKANGWKGPAFKKDVNMRIIEMAAKKLGMVIV